MYFPIRFSIASAMLILSMSLQLRFNFLPFFFIFFFSACFFSLFAFHLLYSLRHTFRINYLCIVFLSFLPSPHLSIPPYLPGFSSNAWPVSLIFLQSPVPPSMYLSTYLSIYLPISRYIYSSPFLRRRFHLIDLAVRRSSKNATRHNRDRQNEKRYFFVLLSAPNLVRLLLILSARTNRTSRKSSSWGHTSLWPRSWPKR